MTQWVISQAPVDQDSWPDNVPNKVDGAAESDAAALIDTLSHAVRVEGNKVVVPQWAMFQIAAHLMHIRNADYRSNEN